MCGAELRIAIVDEVGIGQGGLKSGTANVAGLAEKFADQDRLESFVQPRRRSGMGFAMR